MDFKEISEEKEYGLSNKNYCFSFEVHEPNEMTYYLYFSLFGSKSSNMEKLECMLKLFDYYDELPNQEPLKLNFDKLKYLILNRSIGGQISEYNYNGIFCLEIRFYNFQWDLENLIFIIPLEGSDLKTFINMLHDYKKINDEVMLMFELSGISDILDFLIF